MIVIVIRPDDEIVGREIVVDGKRATRASCPYPSSETPGKAMPFCMTTGIVKWML